MVNEILLYAYSTPMGSMVYDLRWASETLSWDSSMQQVKVGPNMSVASFIDTVLKTRYGAALIYNINEHAMVVGRQTAYSASQGKTLRQVLHGYNTTPVVTLSITQKMVNVTFNFIDVAFLELTVDITKTFGELKKQLTDNKKADLTGYCIEGGGEVYNDDVPLAFVTPNALHSFKCTKI